jgi:hypothetical protein
MTCDGTRPEDLASELGMSGKTLRAWLRDRFTRESAHHGTNWYLTHAQVAAARRRYGPTLGRPLAGSSSVSSALRHEKTSFTVERTVPESSPAPSSAPDIIDAIQARPKSVQDAQRPPGSGGLPADPGFYAWWTWPGAIEGIPLTRHPDSRLGLALFYVGIAPRGPTSSSTIRSRVIGNHLSGNTGSSTLRFTLAALLLRELNLHPKRTATKVLLPSEENRRLSAWQREHLQLTWCVTGQPWVREQEVIARMEPPLNLAGNASHPFYSILSDARVSFRRAADQLEK